VCWRVESGGDVGCWFGEGGVGAGERGWVVGGEGGRMGGWEPGIGSWGTCIKMVICDAGIRCVGYRHESLEQLEGRGSGGRKEGRHV